MTLCIAINVQADPFEGFFTGDGEAPDTTQVSEFFDELNNQPDTLAIAKKLDDAIEPQISAMRLLGGVWFQADEAQRSDFLEVFSAFLQQRMQALKLTELQVDAIQASGGDSWVETRVVDASEEELTIRWLVRPVGSRITIIAAETASGSVFLPGAVHEEAHPSLEELTRILQASLPDE